MATPRKFLLSLHRLDGDNVDAAYDESTVVVEAADKQAAFRIASQTEAEINDERWVVRVTDVLPPMSQRAAREALVAAAAQASR